MSTPKHTYYIDSKRDTVIIDIKDILGVIVNKNNNKKNSFEYYYSIQTTEDDYDALKEHLKKYLVINSFDPNFIKGKNDEHVDRTCITSKPYKLEVYNGTQTYITITLQNMYSKDIVFNFSVKYNQEKQEKQELFTVIAKSNIQKYEIYENTGNIIGGQHDSFMLIRTNPKLTGNIKLVVDTDYKLYLDTFKVSQVLSNGKYRHQYITSEGNYAKDVKMVFGTLPRQEMFYINKANLNCTKCYTEYSNQYNTTYEYGAETNNDLLYSENMKILAPIKLGKDVPDYFCIFRVNKVHNESSYTGSFNDTEIFQDMLKDAVCVQIYDLRNHTSIGQYLRNYHKQIKDITGSMFLQFVEQDAVINPDAPRTPGDFKSGINRWYGISIDNGILTSKVETSYNANKVIFSNHQENMDLYYLSGFERNNMLCHDILNLEFMFNDKDCENFKLNNYFGLYLKANDIIKYHHIINDYTKDGNEIETRYDENSEPFDDKEYLNNILDNEEYSNRIFLASTNNKNKYIKNTHDLEDFLYDNVVNKPMDNIINGRAIELDLENGSFVVVKFKHYIKYGEHFRIIDNNNKTIYEVIGSNDSRLATSKNKIYPYVQTNVTNGYTINRVSFFTQDTPLLSRPATLDAQIQRLQAAFNAFGIGLRFFTNEDTISIITGNKGYIFEHINAESFVDPNKTYYGIDDLYYFNDTVDVPLNFIQYDIDKVKDDKKCFGMHDFQYFGNRVYSAVSFLDLGKLNFYQIDKKLSTYENINVDLLTNTIKGYCKLDYFYIDYVTPKNVAPFKINNIISPYDLKFSAICSEIPILLIDHKIYLYNYTNCNVSLMGIYGIKDFDMRIHYDKNVTYNIGNTITLPGNTIIKFGNGFDELSYNTIYSLKTGRLTELSLDKNCHFYCENVNGDDVIHLYYKTNIINTTEERNATATLNKLICETDVTLEVVDYVYSSYSYSTNEPVHELENYEYTEGILSAPVVPQISCFWEGISNYYDKVNTLSVNTLNEPATIEDATTLSVLPHIKKLKINDGWTDIIVNQSNQELTGWVCCSLQDKVLLNGNYYSFYDLILNNDIVINNPIHQYLLLNGNPVLTKGYYNKYVDTFEFIYNSIKFTLKFSSTDYNYDVRFSEYNNYDVCILLDYNPDLDNEFIVSTQEEIILIINHSFNNLATYSRYQHFTDGGYNNTLKWFKSKNTLDFSLVYGNQTNIIIPKSNVVNELNISDDAVHGWIQHDYIDQNESNLYNNSDNYYWQIQSSPGITLDKPQALYVTNRTSGNVIYPFMNSTNGHTTTCFNFNVFGNKSNLKKNTFVYFKNFEPEIDLDNYLEKFKQSFDNDFEFTIIDTNKNITKLNKTENYQPLIIDSNYPKKIKYNFGYFVPKYYSLVDFEKTEDANITKLCKNTFLYNNTRIKAVHPINNYFCYKIFDNKLDSYSNLKHNYYSLNEKSIMSCLWDYNYYRKYVSENKYKNINGYLPGYENKSMFGSVCLVINKPKINITKWNFTGGSLCVRIRRGVNKFNLHTKMKNSYVVEFNLTRALYNYINYSDEFKPFVSQWDSFNKDNKTAINNYIKQNILQKYFKISENCNFKLYHKIGTRNAGLNIIYDMPEDFDTNWDEYKNFLSGYRNDNDEIILEIHLDNVNNITYYPIFEITK